MIVVGKDGRGQAICIDPTQLVCVTTQAMVTYTPQTYRLYLKNGVIFDVDVGDEASPLGAFEEYLSGRDAP